MVHEAWIWVIGMEYRISEELQVGRNLAADRMEKAKSRSQGWLRAYDSE